MQFGSIDKRSFSKSIEASESLRSCIKIFGKIGYGGTNNRHQSMVTLTVSHTVISMHVILNVMETGERPHMKPGDYIALHLLNCVICAITIGVLYNVYFG